MAVGKNYDGSKVQPVIKDGVIRVTVEWLNANVTDKSKPVEDLLNNEMVGQSICPRTFSFNDTPEVRKALGLDVRGKQ